MSWKFYYSIFLLVCFILTSPILADENSEEKKSGYVILPVIGYAPETKLELGARLSYYFRTPGSDDDSRPSTIAPIVSYTQNSQLYSKLVLDFYFQNELYHLVSEINYFRYPDVFYGKGNQVSIDDEENYTPIKSEFVINFQRRILTQFYIGAQYEYRHTKMTKFEEGGQLYPKTIYGSNGGLSSGLSLLLSWDTRENIFAPIKGLFYQLMTSSFESWLGSDYTYQAYRLELRNYFPFFSTHTLGFHGVMQITTGKTPFNRLSLLGSDKILRGYHNSLFRDKVMWALQTEYRFPVWWRFGLTGFAGLGNVHPSFNNLSLSHNKSSFGVGLRYFLVPEEKINIRLDVAFGENSSGVYLYFLEAF